MIPRTRSFILCLWLVSSVPVSEASSKKLSLSKKAVQEALLDELAYRLSDLLGAGFGEEEQEISSPPSRKKSSETPSSPSLNYNSGKAVSGYHGHLIRDVMEDANELYKDVDADELDKDEELTSASSDIPRASSTTLRAINNTPSANSPIPKSPVPATPNEKTKRYSFFELFYNSGVKGGAVVNLPTFNGNIQMPETEMSQIEIKKAPSPRENTAKLIQTAFPHFNQRQLNGRLKTYTKIFPSPMSDPNPERYASTIPLVVQLAGEMALDVQYKCLMDTLSEWELIAGFVMDLSENPAVALLDRMNRDSQEDPQFVHLLNEMTAGDEKALIGLREAARRQVVRSVAAASTMPIEASEIAAMGNHLRVMGTQRKIFYHPGLLQVSALVAQSFDGTHAQEIFNLLIRKRLRGVWGPNRNELKQIYRGEFVLSEEALPLEKENALKQYEVLQVLSAEAFELIKEAFRRGGKANLLNSMKLTKDLVKTELLARNLKSIINSCSDDDLITICALLEEIKREGEEAFRDFIKMREIKFRGSSRRRIRDSLPANSIIEPVLKRNSIFPRLSFYRQPKPQSSPPETSKKLEKTLDEVVEGSLKILEVLKRREAAISLDRAMAYDKIHLQALRCLFLNIFGCEKVKLLLFELLALKEGKWLRRGGELVYAAYLLTLQKQNTSEPEAFFATFMKEFKATIIALRRQKENVLFAGLGELSRWEAHQFSDSESDDEDFFDNPF